MKNYEIKNYPNWEFSIVVNNHYEIYNDWVIYNNIDNGDIPQYVFTIKELLTELNVIKPPATC